MSGMGKVRLLAVIGTLFVLCGLALAVVSSQSDSSAAPVAQVATESVVPTVVNTIPLPSTISGVVMNQDGPVAGAIVQIQAAPEQFETDENGAFSISGIVGTTPITVTAWSAGHYIGFTTLNPSAPDWQGGDNINITLRPLSTSDNSDYGWFSFEGVDGSASCGLCHREYSEWQADQHSQSAVNHRFLTMYMGTNMAGEEGQPVAYGSDGVPLPPDPSQPYYGPGYLRDNRGRVGNCATCHTPLASTSPNNQNCSWSGCHTSLTIERANGLIAQQPRMPQHLTGDAAEGITCEFCHVVGDVLVSSETNLPMPDMPGILSMRLFRPDDESEQVFFGTLVDVSRQDSYLPLLSESRFCAGCHYGVLGGVMGVGTMTGGVLIYSSYSEWLESPYSNPETGMSCQDCHMPVSDQNWFVSPVRGGVTRDYVELRNHTMPGAADAELLQNAVTMVSNAERSGDQIAVEVSITNDQTGHHVPTDVPIRSMILVVEAVDANGQMLTLLEGPVNPAYSGDYGGLPGRTFAKILQDDWTGEMPTAAFWRPVTIVEDTRIAAMATDTTNYVFDAPAGSEITINVRLIYRRAFYDLMQQKGWNDPDIMMEEATLQVPAN